MHPSDGFILHLGQLVILCEAFVTAYTLLLNVKMCNTFHITSPATHGSQCELLPQSDFENGNHTFCATVALLCDVPKAAALLLLQLENNLTLRMQAGQSLGVGRGRRKGRYA